MALLINDKGGMKIDGMTNKYLCTSEKINMGEFVNYTNEFKKIVSDSSSIYGSGQNLDSCLLDGNKVFVVHRKSADDSSLAGMLFKVEGNTVTELRETTLVSGDGAGYQGHCEALNGNQVLVTYSSGGNAVYMMAVVVTVDSNDSIKTSTPFVVSNAIRSGEYNKLVKITDNKFLVLHSSSQDYYFITGTVITVEGETITKYTTTELVKASRTSFEMQGVAIDENKVFIAYASNQTNAQLMGAIVTINQDNTLSIGTNHKIFADNDTGKAITLTKMERNKVLLTHNFKLNQNYMGAMVIKIDGDSLTVGKEVEYTNIRTNVGSSRNVAIPYSEKEAVFLHHFDNDGSIAVMLIGVEGMNVIKFNTVRLDNYTGSANDKHVTKLNDGRIFIAHKFEQTSAYLTGTLCELRKEARVCDTKDSFIGIATKRAIKNQQVEIAVPKV